MEPNGILNSIREKECKILALYQNLAKTNLGIVSSALNVSFDSVKALRDAPDSLCDNLMNAFNANTSTLFTVTVEAIPVPPMNAEDDQDIHSSFQEIRKLERHILLQMRDLCITHKNLARSCLCLSDETILKLAAMDAPQIIDYCYSLHRHGQILHIKMKNPKAFIQMIKIASKPCSRVFGFLLDRMAG